VFRAACVMGLEGIVAKRRDSRYRSGRCADWIKLKNSGLFRSAPKPLQQLGVIVNAI
jgi:ATP-dependent DNA ligase